MAANDPTGVLAFERTNELLHLKQLENAPAGSNIAGKALGRRGSFSQSARYPHPSPETS